MFDEKIREFILNYPYNGCLFIGWIGQLYLRLSNYVTISAAAWLAVAQRAGRADESTTRPLKLIY